jgi:hypothetical protein
MRITRFAALGHTRLKNIRSRKKFSEERCSLCPDWCECCGRKKAARQHGYLGQRQVACPRAHEFAAPGSVSGTKPELGDATLRKAGMGAIFVRDMRGLFALGLRSPSPYLAPLTRPYLWGNERRNVAQNCDETIVWDARVLFF